MELLTLVIVFVGGVLVGRLSPRQKGGGLTNAKQTETKNENKEKILDFMRKG